MSKLTNEHSYIDSQVGTIFYTFYLVLGLASSLDNIINGKFPFLMKT